MKTFIISSVFLCLQFQVWSQDVLDKYIREGLKNNLALQNQELALQQSMETLNQAKALFLPQLSFNASYTQAAGGRNISIPVGSLVNPVYSTLNELTDSQRFPTNLADIEEQLLPDNFHDTRVQLRQTLFNSTLYHNLRAQRSAVSIQESQKQAYQEELTKEIKIAYYRYGQSVQLLDILGQTQQLLEELVRVNQSLVNNHKATIDVVYRAEFELSDLASQQAQAQADREVAKSYFNFLLNRDLQSEIILPSSTLLESIDEEVNLLSYQQQALKFRQELKQTQHAIEAQSHLIKLQKGQKLPRLTLGAQAGYQGFGYDFGSNQDYALLQFNLEFPLFTGFHNNSKIQQSRIQLKQLEKRHQELQQQIQVQVIQAYKNAQAAYQDFQAKQAGARSAASNFKIINRKYRENMVLLVEYLDARTLLTNSQTQLAIAKYQMLIRNAELVRAAAL